MKIRKASVLILLLAFIFILFASARQSWAQDQEAYLLESTNLECFLGVVEKGRIVEQDVVIKNNLDEPLAVNEARSVCECIQSFVKPQIVDRGETFELEIVLDTAGMAEGDIEEVVYILSENMDYEIIRLVISASVIDTK